MCSIEIVPLSVCPSVRQSVPYFFHISAPRELEYKLRTIYLPGVRPEFLIRGLEVLGLGPLSKCDFFNINFLKTGISVFNTMKNGVQKSTSK
jgi:hypothetical protein